MTTMWTMNRMIKDATLAVRDAQTDEGYRAAVNRLDELIALRKDMVESKSDSGYKFSALAVTLFGTIFPAYINRQTMRECIQFEHNGIWSHPTIKSLASKIHIGK